MEAFTPKACALLAFKEMGPLKDELPNDPVELFVLLHKTLASELISIETIAHKIAERLKRENPQLDFGEWYDTVRGFLIYTKFQSSTMVSAKR